MTRYIPGMLTCQEVDNYLFNYHEGNLSTTERMTFKFHLSMCAECREYVHQYQNAIACSKSAFSEDYSTVEVPEELMQIILKNRTTKP